MVRAVFAVSTAKALTSISSLKNSKPFWAPGPTNDVSITPFSEATARIAILPLDLSSWNSFPFELKMVTFFVLSKSVTLVLTIRGS